MKKNTFFPCQMNEAILLVTSYDQGQLHGWLSHSRMETPVEVCSVPHLLFSIDDYLLSESRMINPNAFAPTGLEDLPRQATLRIRILFQENHTWQGLLRWDERGKEASFRSVWELIQILDEVLSN